MKTIIPHLAGSLALVVSMVSVSTVEAQMALHSAAQTSISTPSLIGSQISTRNAYLSVLTQKMASDRLRAMSEDRQKHIVNDTYKLVGLATQLQQQMKGDAEIPPIDLSRCAAEIERLAHEVQNRMKN